MCVNCWEESGSPQIDTPEVRHAAACVSELHRDHSTGGLLHIVVDDWNLETEHVEWCLSEEALRCDRERAPHGPAPEIVIDTAAALLVLSEEGRASALALARGFWKPAARRGR